METSANCHNKQDRTQTHLSRWTSKCPVASIISVKQEHSYESYDSLSKVQRDSASQMGFFK